MDAEALVVWLLQHLGRTRRSPAVMACLLPVLQLCTQVDPGRSLYQLCQVLIKGKPRPMPSWTPLTLDRSARIFLLFQSVQQLYLPLSLNLCNRSAPGYLML